MKPTILSQLPGGEERNQRNEIAAFDQENANDYVRPVSTKSSCEPAPDQEGGESDDPCRLPDGTINKQIVPDRVDVSG